MWACSLGRSLSWLHFSTLGPARHMEHAHAKSHHQQREPQAVRIVTFNVRQITHDSRRQHLGDTITEGKSAHRSGRVFREHSAHHCQHHADNTNKTGAVNHSTEHDACHTCVHDQHQYTDRVERISNVESRPLPPTAGEHIP